MPPGPTGACCDDRPAPLAWLEALERRHLADLTPSEVARALRALSSCYVERRDRLPRGGALDSAGKRAAFALFYAPLHFFVTRAILTALPDASADVSEVLDVGCGTGAAGAAWALASGATADSRHRSPSVGGRGSLLDLPPAGSHRPRRAARREPGALMPPGGHRDHVAYTANELADGLAPRRSTSCWRCKRQGARVLVIEPIARRTAPWWGGWEDRVVAAGGRADEWRFPSDLPPRPLALARAAGLDPRELTARTLYLPPAPG